MRRAMGVVGGALAVAVLVAALAAPAVGAKVRYPRLDPSFGSGGYASLRQQLPAPAIEPMTVRSFGAAPGGSVYALQRTPVRGSCAPRCGDRAFIARIKPNGSIATGFGGEGWVEVGSALDSLSPVVADAKGRALVVSQRGSELTVYRYLADGSPDASFGRAGSISFDCECGLVLAGDLKLGIDGRERIVVSVNVPTVFVTSQLLARLLPDGTLDTGFAGDGLLWLGEQRQPLGIASGAMTRSTCGATPAVGG